MSMCKACEEGRHWDCNNATWCDCECDPELALIDLCFMDEDPFNYLDEDTE